MDLMAAVFSCRFPHRATLTVVLLELDYAQAYAVDKDAEGALFAPAAANVEALWFPVLTSCVPFQSRDYGERHRRADGQSPPLGTRRLAERLCPWLQARDLPRPKLTNCSE